MMVLPTFRVGHCSLVTPFCKHLMGTPRCFHGWSKSNQVDDEEQLSQSRKSASLPGQDLLAVRREGEGAGQHFHRFQI